MVPIEVRNGDDLPVIYARILHVENQLPVDLSAASTTVSAKFRPKGDEDATPVSLTVTKQSSGEDGWVKIEWPATALDVDAGRHEIEISVSFNGAIQTVRKYYWDGSRFVDAKTLPVRVRNDF